MLDTALCTNCDGYDKLGTEQPPSPNQKTSRELYMEAPRLQGFPWEMPMYVKMSGAVGKLHPSP